MGKKENKVPVKKEPELNNLCLECGAPCQKKYCSKLCLNRGWKKSAGFRKNKCLVCGEPSSNMYCSYKCRASVRKKNHKAICEFCGKEFSYPKITVLNRGLRFCSDKCKSSKYTLQENYFTHGEPYDEVYKTLGFLFASGVISDIKLGIIDIVGKKDDMTLFAKTIKSTYKLNNTDGKEMKRTLIRSKEMTDYLFSIGFSSAKETHDFPLILPEFKLDFIKGYAAINSELHQNNEVMFINTKSYSLARGIAEFLNCELVTKHLGFICIVRNIDTITELNSK